MESVVPIGRFAKVTRLSIKALRHYDEIGLLPPAEVDPSSGYRYYRLTQANHAEAIRLLRSLDMPLEEIRSVLEAEDPESRRSTWPSTASVSRSALPSTDGCSLSSSG